MPSRCRSTVHSLLPCSIHQHKDKSILPKYPDLTTVYLSLLFLLSWERDCGMVRFRLLYRGPVVQSAVCNSCMHAAVVWPCRADRALKIRVLEGGLIEDARFGQSQRDDMIFASRFAVLGGYCQTTQQKNQGMGPRTHHLVGVACGGTVVKVLLIQHPQVFGRNSANEWYLDCGVPTPKSRSFC